MMSLALQLSTVGLHRMLRLQTLLSHFLLPTQFGVDYVLRNLLFLILTSYFLLSLPLCIREARHIKGQMESGWFVSVGRSRWYILTVSITPAGHSKVYCELERR